MNEEKIQEWGWDEFEESMQPETGSGFVKKEDHLRIFQSERQARLDAETKLRELQDAVERAISLNPKFEKLDTSVLDQAIQESRIRRQNDDTTI